MSLFLNKLCSKKDLNSCRVLAFYIVNRGKQHWFPQYKPGPYPKTEEERRKAAAKYNLLPEEYEPYPDNGDGLGDYPMLPEESPDMKDPWYPYDIPYQRRDFGEPVHRDYVKLQPELFSKAPGRPVSLDRAIDYFLKLGACLFVIYLLSPYRIQQGVMQRQLWQPNAVHYSFDVDPTQKAPKPKPVEPEPPQRKVLLHTRYPRAEMTVPIFPIPFSSKLMKW